MLIDTSIGCCRNSAYSQTQLIFFSITSFLSPNYLVILSSTSHINQKHGRNFNFLFSYLISAQVLSIPYPDVSLIIITSSQFILLWLHWFISHQIYHNTLLTPIFLPSNPSSIISRVIFLNLIADQITHIFLKSFCEFFITYRTNSLASHRRPYVLMFFLIPNFSPQVTLQVPHTPILLMLLTSPLLPFLLLESSFHSLLSSWLAPTHSLSFFFSFNFKIYLQH